jgi:excisionase family DNA binding protein
MDATELRAMIGEAVREALTTRDAEESAEWLDAQGAAEVLGVHRRTVAKLAHREGLPAHRIGKLYRFRRTDVMRWLEERGQPPRRA